MYSLRTEALLLRAVDFGESDRIVHLLTPRTGRLTAIARGARRSKKRFGGNLDLCNHLRVQVEQRRRTSMPRLDHAALVDPFEALRRVPLRFALASYVLEIVDRMAPEGGAPPDLRALFGFSIGVLRLLATSRPDARLRVLLELRTLDALGLRPELRHCIGCGRAPQAGEAVGFRVADGGIVCSACALRGAGVMPVHLGTLRSLEQALSLPLEALERIHLPPGALGEGRRLLERFQRFHTGLELRSERVLDRLLAEAATRPAPARDAGAGAARSA